VLPLADCFREAGIAPGETEAESDTECDDPIDAESDVNSEHLCQKLDVPGGGVKI
jgi:hypothetical protein